METKFSRSVPVSVDRATESNGTVEVDTFIWFSEIFLEIMDSRSQCVGMTADQAEELGNALIEAARYRREVDK